MARDAVSVGLVTPRYAPAIGGVEHHVEMLARGLVSRGIGVQVITTDPSGKLPQVEDKDGVFVRRFPTVADDAVYFISPGLGLWLLRNASRFTVLHAHSYHAPLSLQAAVASRWTRVPLVLTPHYHGTGHSLARRALHLPYRLPGRWMVRHARRVLCVSESERHLVHRDFGMRVSTEVIPNGVEVDELLHAQPRCLPSDRVRVLSVGRLEAYKQVERLIAALPFLPPEYEAVVIGDGPSRARIEHLGGELGVSARLQLLNHVSRADLLAWYRTADVFVSLSRREAFGIAVLEAAATDLAVIVSDIPAHREISKYAPPGRISFVSSGCSPAELAHAIRQSRSCDLAAGIRISLLPTWPGAVDSVLACYRNVLRQRDT